MQEFVRIAFLGIVGVLLALQFKGQKSEYGMYIGLGIGILILGYALRQAGAVVAQLNRLRNYLGGTESYLVILLKVIGITYICEFSAGICRDAGYQSIAGQIEVLGKLSVMFVGLPILFAVIEQINGFL